MSSRRPNLFLVGAPRCGTTSLYTYLAAHPDVYMSPVKELHYFSSDVYLPTPQITIADEAEYLSMFDGATGQLRLGEASPFYIYSNIAAEHIRSFQPEAHVIITLRNPADMMYSMYHFLIRAATFHVGQEWLPSFEEALAAGPARLAGRGLPPGAPTEPGRCIYLCYRELGRYAGRVERYLRVFGPDRVHVTVLEDLVEDPTAVYRRICRFLNIDDTFAPDFELSRQRRAAGGGFRSAWLARLLWRPTPAATRIARAVVPSHTRRSLRTRLEHWNDRPPPDLDPETRRRLNDESRSDVARLSTLLGRDLTGWLRDPAP